MVLGERLKNNMAKKAKPTKTINPIHFEDLDPYRFEDLVRNLIHGFKWWQSIEATGRGGSDEGFDVRAWERTQEVVNVDDEGGEKGVHPMEGNLWKIQCKREKKLGPSRVKKIIDEGVDKNDPPYGYILVAPTTFSKRSYDAFRNGLREKGVMEFYLWGKAELEDMLYLPKNDHILFAFFGISLVTRKRSRSSEIRFMINNKNKLLKVLNGNDRWRSLHKSVLVRDYKDTHYPWKEKYEDFDKRSRWKEHIVVRYHPLGLIIEIGKYFAFADLGKKKWDYTKAVDLVSRRGEQRYRNEDDDEVRKKVDNFYRYLPKSNQAKFVIEGIIFFEDILVIDGKGDSLHSCPHIFVDFKLLREPFRGFWYFLEINNRKIELDEDEFKRVKVFPKKFPKIKKGKVYKDKSIQLDSETFRIFKRNVDYVSAFFDIDKKYNFLNVRDIILVSSEEKDQEKDQEKVFIRITHKYSITVKKYLDNAIKEHQVNSSRSYLRKTIEKQVGRKINNQESLTVFEFEKIYAFQMDQG